MEEVTARSNWLLDQIDVRGWAHSIVPQNVDDVVHLGRGGHMLLLFTRQQKSRPRLLMLTGTGLKSSFPGKGAVPDPLRMVGRIL